MRPLGATAVLGRSGYPRITSAAGGTLTIATGAAEPGFNPIDLLYASLSACMAMSARIAAKQLGLLERAGTISVTVSGEKEKDGAGDRVTRFTLVLSVAGALDRAEAERILHLAEEICTVSRTLEAGASLRSSVSVDAEG